MLKYYIMVQPIIPCYNQSDVIVEFQYILLNKFDLKQMDEYTTLPLIKDYEYETMMQANQQLVHDNIALANEIYRLRDIITSYQIKVIQLQKNEEYHLKQIHTLNTNTGNILQRLQKSDQHTTQQISETVKKLKKQVIYKKLQALEDKYEKKNTQCEQLLGFKNKIQRIRLSWDLKCKDKSLDGLFTWVYNQIVKAKGMSTLKKSKNHASKSRNETLRDQSQTVSVRKLDKKLFGLCDTNEQSTQFETTNQK